MALVSSRKTKLLPELFGPAKILTDGSSDNFVLGAPGAAP